MRMGQRPGVLGYETCRPGQALYEIPRLDGFIRKENQRYPNDLKPIKKKTPSLRVILQPFETWQGWTVNLLEGTWWFFPRIVSGL